MMMPKQMNINARTADARLHLWRDMMPEVSCQLPVGHLPIQSAASKLQLILHSGFQFTNSGKLAPGS